MSLETLKSQFSDYAKDTKLNLSKVLSEDGSPGLTQNQIYGTALAAAYAVKNRTVLNELAEEFEPVLSDAERNAAKAAVTVMAMNNVYYRAIHLMSDHELSNMPAGLRMNVIANPGVPKVDFECYSLAVSAINGCGACIESHARSLEKEGVSKQGVQSCLRIAGVISAAAQAMWIEQK